MFHCTNIQETHKFRKIDLSEIKNVLNSGMKVSVFLRLFFRIYKAITRNHVLISENIVLFS